MRILNNSFSVLKNCSMDNMSVGNIYSDDKNNILNSLSDEDYDMNVIAHRGSSKAPENTLEAFYFASENGYDTVECDISWTKDGVPVILHDSTINRTARNIFGWKILFPKKCSKLTYEELLKYDFGIWKGDEYKDTKIPTFDEVLDCGKECDLNIYVELKKDDNFNLEKARKLVKSVKDAGLEDKITWISFNEKYLKIINYLVPEARLGYLSKKKVNDNTIDILNDLKTDKNGVFLDIKANKINQQSSELLKNSGFDFEVWTVNDINNVDELYSFGCRGITTDSLTEEQIEKYLDAYDAIQI